MNVLISGASGLVGTSVESQLRRDGHLVQPLVRGKSWDVGTGRLSLGGFWPDIVIHLAGESVAGGRWTEARKKRIRESRVEATQRFSSSLVNLPKPPRIVICASAVGFYGCCGDEPLTENSHAGDDFLARVCIDWENATKPLQNAGVRVVHLRFGMVLSPTGGALAKMLPIFRLGLGGPFGNGSQWISWIALEDLVSAILLCIENENESVSGAFNAVSPVPVSNREFTHVLGRVLKRPAILPVPTFALRFFFGELADATLLASQRAYPERLQKLGFTFRHPNLEEALRSML